MDVGSNESDHRPAFQSNNPFAIQDHTSNTENDDELQRALEISRENLDEDTKRAQRERSLRAGGVPPPSPEIRAVDGPVFGPSNKEDKDGSKMSLVPTSAAVHQVRSVHKMWREPHADV